MAGEKETNMYWHLNRFKCLCWEINCTFQRERPTSLIFWQLIKKCGIIPCLDCLHDIPFLCTISGGVLVASWYIFRLTTKRCAVQISTLGEWKMTLSLFQALSAFERSLNSLKRPLRSQSAFFSKNLKHSIKNGESCLFI